jgi:hypothetical protein
MLSVAAAPDQFCRIDREKAAGGADCISGLTCYLAEIA